MSFFWADLSGVDLYQGKPGAGFTGIDLIGADLRNADLRGANLAWADLTGATLCGVDLRDAALGNATLHGANLRGADLRGANAAGASLLMADLGGANLAGVNLYETVFSDTDFSEAVGLDACHHSGPCTVDHRTLLGHGALPAAFLRGCGLPDELIELALVFEQDSARFYSCFISCSSKDRSFIDQLYADLQENGVRCWVYFEDLGTGEKQWDAILRAVKSHDKLLLVCSATSLESDWVEDEVNAAFSEEAARKTTVLFPIRIDDAVMGTEKPWAVRVRNSRNIGDFTSWQDEGAYKEALDRLLRDLSAVAG